MTNYIIPSTTDQGETLDLDSLDYPCKVTDLRTGAEIVIEARGDTPVPVGAQPITVRASGPNSERPSLSEPSNIAYFDTDEGRPIWYDGGKWVFADGTESTTMA